MNRAGASGLPWVGVETNGELERAEREWIHSNGAGAYSMSTVALMHTRREHGLLVASLDPPDQRIVVLSHAETTVTVGSRRHRLSTHRFPGVAPTPGFRSLIRYDQDPIPRWTYRLGKHVLERRLCLVPGKNVLVLRYDWYGKAPARLSLMPLLSMRPIGDLMREHGAMVQRVTLRSGEVEVQPVRSLPPVLFRHSGIFMGSPDWWRRFEYSEDRAQRRGCEEDLWTPGTFELEVAPGQPCYLATAFGDMPAPKPPELMQETIDGLLSQDPGPDFAPSARSVFLGAQDFAAQSEHGETFLVAGYPDLGATARDHLVALPAFTLFDGSLDVAQRMLETSCRRLRAGLLPQNFKNTDRTHPCPDATLWLFEAGRHFVERVGPEHSFARGQLFSALVRVYLRMRRVSSDWVWTTPEGMLVTASRDGFPMTWMDAFHAGQAVTPRNGIAVEHQALWVRGCAFLGELAGALGHVTLAEAASESSQRGRQAFSDRFWCNETEYPFDCISPEGDTAQAWADPTIRPNALIALAVAPECFESWQASNILERVERELLTQQGVRTLTPNDERYQGVCEGAVEERANALHQGTAWSHLVGTYVRTAAREEAAEEASLWALLQQVLASSQVLGHVGQMADGETPHRARGCPAQGWAQSEVLRALMRLEQSRSSYGDGG